MASARTFDMKISVNVGPEVAFTSITKEEQSAIETFLDLKKVTVQNEVADDVGMAVDLGSDDDAEMQSVASEDERPKVKKPAGEGGGGDDDEESSEGQPDESIYFRIGLLTSPPI